MHIQKRYAIKYEVRDAILIQFIICEGLNQTILILNMRRQRVRIRQSCNWQLDEYKGVCTLEKSYIVCTI